jgi:hypothetical protein
VAETLRGIVLNHFHLQYCRRTGTPATKYGASFFSEIEAVQAAGLANATRGAETGYYSIQQCHRGACRPEPSYIGIERAPASGVFPGC